MKKKLQIRSTLMLYLCLLLIMATCLVSYADAVLEPDDIITPQNEGSNIVILIAAMVVVVVAGTFILIRVLFKGDSAKGADAEKAP